MPGAYFAAPAQSVANSADDDRDPGLVTQADIGSVVSPTDSIAMILPKSRPREESAVPAQEIEILKGNTGDSRPVNGVVAEPRLAVGPPAGWEWESLILAVFLSGAVGWWTLAAVRIVQFQRVLLELQPVPEEWQSHADLMAERMGLSQCPRLWLVPGRVPPMLWAIGGRPRLLVPSQLWAAMDEDERASLVLHELAHLKRRDHWVRWLELVVAGLYWWHPVAWWARHELREAEEQCCDAWVVWAMPQKARTYASALLTALEFVSGARTVPVGASATSGNRACILLEEEISK